MRYRRKIKEENKRRLAAQAVRDRQGEEERRERWLEERRKGIEEEKLQKADAKAREMRIVSDWIEGRSEIEIIKQMKEDYLALPGTDSREFPQVADFRGAATTLRSMYPNLIEEYMGWQLAIDKSRSEQSKS